MKKSRIISTIILIVLMLAMLIPTSLPVSAASKDFYKLADAAGVKSPLMNPEYITGGAGFNDKEGSASILVYDEDSDDFPKYCTDQLPYHVEWKYDKDYVVNRIILRTGNDSAKSPRRMGDGWTLSGSNDGADWKVIYTGKETDVDNEDDAFYYIDLNSNTDSFQYYKLFSENAGSSEEQDRNLIQYGMIVLCSGFTPWQPKNFKIEGEKTVITAVDFDADKFNESTPQRAIDGNWTWYVDSRKTFGNYALRPEFQEKENGPQTEAAEIEGLGPIGGICYTHDDEWVQYTLDVVTAGKYDVKVWASTDAGAGKIIDLSIGDTVIGSPEIESKGWTNYNLHDVGMVDLAAGTNILKLAWATGDANIAAFEFTLLEAAAVSEDPPAVVAGDDAAPADDAGVDTPAAETTKAEKADNEGGPNTILFIIIGAGVLVVIIIVVVIVASKKKK